MGTRTIHAELKRMFNRFGIIPVSVILTGLMANAAVAETRVPVIVEDGEIIELPTVQEQVLDTYFTQDQDFYRNHQFPRTLIPIFGIIENDIGGDGRHVHELYEELLHRQVNPYDLIRVADLPTPFTGSLATTPLYVEEPIPPAPIPRYAPREEPVAPSSRPSSRDRQDQPERSVPALW